ncbi:unnamed protein product [Mytilus edulis]|uniref:DDE Tnp4 domain-containing protein n=1 Tax=Mytilus edulis TaxID=6550 RepID=A0A8S3S327_MYTED|nr:unnamed protein product [Mytilus edulis]
MCFFIPFPKPTTRRVICLKWIKASGRPGNDFNVDKIKRSTYICSKHFVGESGPTADNPDPIPALLHTDEQEASLLVLCPATDASSQTVDIQTNDKEVQTIYEKEVLNAKIENMILKNQMRNCESRQIDQPNEQNDTTLSIKAIKDNDAKMKLFTGLTYAQFCILFNFLGTSVYNLTYSDGNNYAKESSRKRNRKLEPKDELFLTLNNHTYKRLIGIAPNGSIVYVSDLFEGSIIDRAIIEQSGVLDYINPGDLVLADRGFTIKDLLIRRQAFLNKLGKRKKFTAQEELNTRRITKARIHVERVIERVKKNKLLSGNIPLSLSPIANQLVLSQVD